MPVLKTPMRACLRITLALILVAASAVASLARGPASFAPLAAELQGAVVNISTTYIVNSNGRGFPFPNVPESSPLREFFDKLQPQQPPESDEPIESRSLGSGFVIDPNGTIVTNYHVIEGATEVFVAFVDGTRVEARVIGADEKTDLAVLKVNVDRSLKHVELGDSDTALVGDWVVAIGNPFGLGGSLSAGIVSARNRDIRSGPYDNFIQTDAAINQGNSGGPLFNMNGEVVGINTAIISQSGGSLGIGFSIPINLAKPVIEQLIEFGETRRGWLGVEIQDVSEDIAAGLGRPDTAGALVSGVVQGSPSDGVIEEGDLILAFDGKSISKMRDLPRIVAETEVGKKVKLGVLRRGQIVELEITLGRLEQVDPFMGIENLPPEEVPVNTGSLLGLSVADIDDGWRERFGIPKNIDGAVVSEVEVGSDAEDKGLRIGHTILEVNQQLVYSALDVKNIVGTAAEAGREVILLKIADPTGSRRFVAIRLNK
ncbi:Do family serine endopeptidase [Maritalea porphyrae]|uniref:Probable periplasmic serine endoprotease DegP-like n=1 Tax=Maritalea porphyrae TaxID=880732 RepID=A0ABQ5UUI3_9HYPH|nr:Do family serine endopeptidase [Maritalea porphyrae]GLQ18934.1 serine protease [Maritalea porphyrae]